MHGSRRRLHAIVSARARPLGHPDRVVAGRHRRRDRARGRDPERLQRRRDGDRRGDDRLLDRSLIVSFFALRVFVRDPSVSLALLLALASTILSLIVVNIIVSGVSVDGVGDYLLAGIIIWICTAIADVIGGRMIRDRRRA